MYRINLPIMLPDMFFFCSRVLLIAAGWAGWLAGWLTGCLPAWLAGWLASWLAGLGFRV